MDGMQILFLALLFLAVYGFVYFLLSQLVSNPMRERLDAVTGGEVPEPAQRPSQWVERIVKITGPLAKLSVPEEGWEGSAVRTHFMNAGLRGGSAPVVYFTAKTALALLLPALLYRVFVYELKQHVIVTELRDKLAIDVELYKL